MPPLVCSNWATEDGYETVDRAKHYGKRAKGGTGVIVVEATAISEEGRILSTELGLWKDGHKEQFQRMAKACKDEGSLILVQLIHAGASSFDKTVYSASVVEREGKVCKEMTLDHINEVKDNFVKASVRAYEAGLDGVEVHGAHGFLLNQFTSKVTNKRDDKYGVDLKGRTRLPIEIIKEIRLATSDDFIIAYRFGVNDPTFEEDIMFAKELEQNGVDLLDVSTGIGVSEFEVPNGYKHSYITYMGTKLHENVSIPVASVYKITTAEQAVDLLENDLTDFVAIGRGLLADPKWADKSISGQEVDLCYYCKPYCRFSDDGHKCPREIKRNK